jgi:hypothetical protein
MRYRIGLGRGDKSQVQGPDTAMPFPYCGVPTHIAYQTLADDRQKRAIDQKQMRTNSLTYNTNSQMPSTEPPKDSLKPCPSQKRPPPKPTLKSTSAILNITSTENKAG